MIDELRRDGFVYFADMPDEPTEQEINMYSVIETAIHKYHVLYKTSKRMSTKKSKIVQTGWGTILEDAQVALRESKARVRAIKKSMKIVQEKIAAGEPCPEYLRRSTQELADRGAS